ncbi:hypothetical protein [Microbacterium amylolyticum]|uniref:DUF4878 domain-containing protein n=1 Tax=Microbacterium amylolyticum TaxID=936337 RepID=A0ABS4ZE42_9MICO|nr:hypothetical protein [Microbacterium amylolyticum]MBP2435551.1 hypothetical protein [Microbacterium amylolyticum]
MSSNDFPWRKNDGDEPTDGDAYSWDRRFPWQKNDDVLGEGDEDGGSLESESPVAPPGDPVVSEPDGPMVSDPVDPVVSRRESSDNLPMPDEETESHDERGITADTPTSEPDVLPEQGTAAAIPPSVKKARSGCGGLVVIIGIVVIIFVAIGGFSGVGAIFERFSPGLSERDTAQITQSIDSLLEDVQRRDAEAVLAHYSDVIFESDALLTQEILDASQELAPLRSWSVEEVALRENSRRVGVATVHAQFGEVSTDIHFPIAEETRGGETAWRLQLTSSASMLRADDNFDITVFETFTLADDDARYVLFPGVYLIDYGVRHVTLVDGAMPREAGATMAAFPYEGEYGRYLSASPDGVDAYVDAVSTELSECIASRELTTPCFSLGDEELADVDATAFIDGTVHRELYDDPAVDPERVSYRPAEPMLLSGRTVPMLISEVGCVIDGAEDTCRVYQGVGIIAVDFSGEEPTVVWEHSSP